MWQGSALSSISTFAAPILLLALGDQTPGSHTPILPPTAKEHLASRMHTTRHQPKHHPKEPGLRGSMTFDGY
ncbi:hypothetical protein N657DRAFT_648078 [Parathielavia appendiculata]|uniref:Secreted protein n=1 Tax=Parathielavia appendiculata TaxID=2587402 RepID=A0AAN6TV16_9PEZI|nr:hypothetical protein N657DRAFT_648078 [Parathielavia appendiculata]